MNETEIANQLKQAVDPPAVHTPAAPVVGDPALVPVEVTDELTQYKLRDYFGVRQEDDASKEQMTFIYKQIAERIGSSDYYTVVDQIRQIEAMIGATHDERRLFKLYQWLKLDGQRTKIEYEMRSLHA